MVTSRGRTRIERRSLYQWVAKYFELLSEYLDGALTVNEYKESKDSFWHTLDQWPDKKVRVQWLITKVNGSAVQNYF